jgi:hypothetical protein
VLSHEGVSKSFKTERQNRQQKVTSLQLSDATSRHMAGYLINQSSELCSHNPLPSSQLVFVFAHVKADPRLYNEEKTYFR